MNFLIVANAPFLARDIILEAAKDRIIVALDGASNNLALLGIKPDVILGDFDSVNESLESKNVWGIQEIEENIADTEKPYPGKFETQIVPAKDQNFTDLQKAIDYCDQNQAQSIDIVCATGARMDHTQSNIRTLRMKYNSARVILLHTESQTLECAKDQSIVMTGEVGEHCGVMAFPDGKFSSTGLKYNTDNYKLDFGRSESTSNKLAATRADIVVQGEALIIHPGKLIAQKKFNSLSQRLQLQILFEQSKYHLIETTVLEWQLFKATCKEIKLQLNIPKQPNPHSYYVFPNKNNFNTIKSNKALLISAKDSKFDKFWIFKAHHKSASEFNSKGFEQELKEYYKPK